MDVILQIPDELAERLKSSGRDLARRAFEALVLDEYKLGHLTRTELFALLGLGSTVEMAEFLQAHGIEKVDSCADEKQQRQKRAQAAAEAIREMSKGVTLGDLKIKDLINEGRQ